jgi:putative membrane protein
MNNLEDERTLLAVERTQMAVERTFLAWIRTGLAGIVGGVALIRFVTFKSDFHRMIAYAVGVLFIFWGIYLFLLSLRDYEKSIHQLNKVSPRLQLNLSGRKAAFILLIALSLAVLFLVL